MHILVLAKPEHAHASGEFHKRSNACCEAAEPFAGPVGPRHEILNRPSPQQLSAS